MLNRIAALALALVLVVAAESAAGVLVPGDNVVFKDSFGSTAGGEFRVDIVGKGVVGFPGSGLNQQQDFITFCLQKNEHITFGPEFDVYAISKQTETAGVSILSGNGQKAAYLFNLFALGTLQDYAFTATDSSRVRSANALQNAIWLLMGQGGSAGSGDQATRYNSYLAQANAASPDALARASSEVSILNLRWTTASTVENYPYAQDMFYRVPDGGSLAALVGLALLGVPRARRWIVR